jgi:glucose-6-phosphate dehydrogenase assembly protein OpcA
LRIDERRASYQSAIRNPKFEVMGIDTAKIESDLKAMWAEEAHGEGPQVERGVVRARVLNLIVYSPAHADRAETDALLSEAYEQNPGRALVVFADPESGSDEIEAYASTRCSIATSGAKQVCGEQVTIEARGAGVVRAASAVASLLVPDVPVFLWWKDIPHYEDKLFTRLVETADRVVIDSAAFDNPHEDLLRLAAVIRENPDQMAVSDLNWGRLTAWRSLVAGFWDVPDYRAHLETVERVTITFSSTAEGGQQISPSAWLILGWLASRLGWSIDAAGMEFAEGGARIGFVDVRGRNFSAELRASGVRDDKTWALNSLTLSSKGSEAEFHVELWPDGSKLSTTARTAGGTRNVERVVDFHEQSEGQRLSNELNILARDRVYEQTVVACAEMIGALGR